MTNESTNSDLPSSTGCSGINIGCGWWASRHAEKRAITRGATVDMVRATLIDPDICYPDPRGAGRVRYIRGELLVIAVPEDNTVITVLLHSDERHQDAA